MRKKDSNKLSIYAGVKRLKAKIRTIRKRIIERENN